LGCEITRNVQRESETAGSQKAGNLQRNIFISRMERWTKT
jgi:hypothetical protein